MKKYYVESGNMRSVIMAANHADACEKAILRRFRQEGEVRFGNIVMTSERSFSNYIEPTTEFEYKFFKTYEVLDWMGFPDAADNYRQVFPIHIEKILASIMTKNFENS